ncbi:hypothetical protein Ocin01_10892, partial [Orchesella cincta]
ARWARKKKSDGAANKPHENEKDVGENSSYVTSNESSEEIELPPFMARSKPIPLNRRDSNDSAEDRHEHDSSSSRRKRASSHSRPKSAKPLKRLNSNNSNNRSLPSVPSKLFDVTNKNGNNNAQHSPSPTQHNSSASPPFSNVDENDYDMEDVYSDKEDVESLGNHESNQKQGQRAEENKDSEMERHRGQEKAVINELTAKFNGKTRSKTGERDHHHQKLSPIRAGKKDLSSASSHNASTTATGRWKERPMEAGATPGWAKISEDRLQEIKQMISRNKKEIGSDTSFSEYVDEDDNEVVDMEENSAKKERKRQLDEKANDDDNNQFQKHAWTDSHLKPDNNKLLTSTAKTTPKGRPQTARQSPKSRYDANDDDDELSLADSSFRGETHRRTNDILPQGQRSNNNDDASKYPGSLETASRKLNSSEEIEDDIRELLNTTMSEEEEDDINNRNAKIIPQSSKRSSSGRPQFSTIQPTQHDTNLSYRMGTAAARGKQHQDKGRKSPSNNSWDSWNSPK